MTSVNPPESTNEPIRVVLIGTERVTRAGLRILLDGHPGLRVIAEAESAGDLGGMWFSTQLQIAVMDLESGIAPMPNFREAGMSNTRVIVLTSTPESVACGEAIERGVMGVETFSIFTMNVVAACIFIASSDIMLSSDFIASPAAAAVAVPARIKVIRAARFIGNLLLCEGFRNAAAPAAPWRSSHRNGGTRW